MPVLAADDGLEALYEARDELLELSGSRLNEADTRAKIIDRVFKDILGWEEAGIKRESRTTAGDYLDYLFSSSTNRFVVEAKRVGTYFDLPAGVILRGKRKGVLSQSKQLSQALDQAVSYAQQQRVPVAVISNGLQFVVTMTYEPTGASGYDSLVFNGFPRLASQFVLFWNLLSLSGSAQEWLERILQRPDSIRPSPQFSERVLNLLPLANESIDRNPVDVALAPLIRKYFGDITSEERKEVLRRAYVESSRQTQYGRQIDGLLSDIAPKLGPQVSTVETSRRSAPEFDLALRREAPFDTDVSQEAVLLLVGGVGAGKTTFLHRYFDFLIDDALRERVLPVFLDFTEMNEEVQDLGAYVDGTVSDGLNKTYPQYSLNSWEVLQQVYRSEIAAMQKGVHKPLYEQRDKQGFWNVVSQELQGFIGRSEQHTQRLIRYLRSQHGKQVCIIFDNVDQLGQSFQHRALKMAFQKAKAWQTLAILALREETFWRYRNSPPFDAFHRHAYHIAAPSIANVLARRLELAQKIEGSQTIGVMSRSGRAFGGISIGQFLQILVDSFLGKDQRNIILLDALSANDVRQALDMFATFLTSGHTNTDEYIKEYVDSGGYIVPLHHLLRSIAFGDRRHYDSQQSLIDNLFSISEDGFHSHFQKIRVLRFLTSVRHLEAAPGRGFYPVSKLHTEFQAIINDEEGLRRILDPLLRHRLIEAANGYRATGETADSVRLTSAGSYYLTSLLGVFAYIDLVSTDTPIKSRNWFERIASNSILDSRLDQRMDRRLAKVESFIDYLFEEEQTEDSYVRQSGLPESVSAPIIDQIKQSFEQERAVIHAKLKRRSNN